MHECIGCLEKQIVHKIVSIFRGGERDLCSRLYRWLRKGLIDEKDFKRNLYLERKFFVRDSFFFFFWNEERNKEIALLTNLHIDSWFLNVWIFVLFFLKFDDSFTLKISNWYNNLWKKINFVYTEWLQSKIKLKELIKREFTTNSLC